MPTNTPTPLDRPPTGRRARDRIRIGLLAAVCGLAFLWSRNRLLDRDPSTPLLRALAGGSVEARRRAAVELGEQPPEQFATVLEGLTAALDDDDPVVRERAGSAIGRATWLAAATLRSEEGVEGDAAIRSLAAHRHDPVTAVRRAIATAVARCAGAASEAPTHAVIVETLRSLMTDPDASVRLTATRSLDDPRYPRDTATLAAFDAATSDPSPGVRHRACFAAISQKTLTDRCRLIVLKALDDPDPLVHRVGEEGVAAFIDRLEIDDVLPRLLARMAIERLKWRSSGEVSMAYTPRGFRNEDRCHRLLAALGERASAAAPWLDRWSSAGEGGSGHDHYEAAAALGAVAPRSPESEARLLKLLAELRSGSHGARSAAARSLGTYLWDRDRVIPALRAAADDPDAVVRHFAARGLAGPDPPLGDFQKLIGGRMPDYR